MLGRRRRHQQFQRSVRARSLVRRLGQTQNGQMLDLVAPGARSDLLPHVAKIRATFPDAYKESFTRYTTVDLLGPKQVRHFY